MSVPQPPSPITRVEITAGIQLGPARCTGAGGTWLDFSRMGQLTFWVEWIAGGSELIVHETSSYEDAIIAAEEFARDEGVPVVDLVGAAS